MVGFAVELAQLGLEAAAYLPHDLFTPLEHVVVEHITPVFRNEHQVCMEVIGYVTSGTDIGVWFPAW
ncbi:hypothetical protein SLA_6308 [Streptomyces laurentii]|uniref:Uncharacterized protein n=1 Tax=Streptomyces laurentii TaxID=39478 RepID=A0A160P5V9_STRLU|nr:hypothetical protein SLA_6308 [Streptomyces laurentii]